MLPLLLPIFLQATQVTPAAASSPLPSPTATGTQPAGTSNRASSGKVLHLDDAINVSLKGQPLIREARAQTAGAVGSAETSRGGLLPQLTGTAIYERTNSASSVVTTGTTGSGSGSTGTGATGSTGGTGTTGSTGSSGTTGVSSSISTNAGGSTNLFEMGVTGSQLIYDFNQTPDRLRAANRNVDSFRANERTTDLTVILNVRTAFFTARQDKSLVFVQEETVRNEEKHVVQVRGFVAAGTQPEIALATELTNLANDKVALITAQNNYEIAKAQLNQSMGVVGTTNYDVAEEGLPAVPGEDGSDEPLIDAALKSRPEIVAYEKTREADVLTVKSLQGGYAPTLSAIGQIGAGGVRPDAFPSLVTSWYAGAELIWPFFQGGVTTGQVHTARANLEYVDAEIENEKLLIRFQVQQAYLTLRAAKASIDAANEALVNAREQLRLAEGRYQQGVGSIIELGDAQIAATTAAAQVVTADFNLSSARAQLLNALGRP